jgi:hypothetical protein
MKKNKVSSLLPLQGDFKDLSKKAFEKLKKSISSHGFIQPFFVWENDGKNFILDGHQRQKAIIDLYGDIFVDCLVIDAANEIEAKKLILYYSSQYGEFDKDSFFTFANDIHFDDLKAFSFPGFNFLDDDDLKVEFPDMKEGNERDGGTVSFALTLDQEKTLLSAISKCENENAEKIIGNKKSFLITKICEEYLK